MKTFAWHRRQEPRGVRWELWTQYNAKMIGQCFYMPGSRNYRCSAGAPVQGGVILTEYYAKTLPAARKALEQDWDKRSIGLFGDDDIQFLEFA